MEYSYSKVTKFNSNLFSFRFSFFSTGIAYLLYFYLKKNVGPTRTVSVTLLVPIFGMIF
ncbi:EamA family transporter [Peribacillus simplex]|uniref:EamA family transporter n=1 Tax=Peribacillus simplex TaxID=1478 RepID=UPI003266F414